MTRLREQRLGLGGVVVVAALADALVKAGIGRRQRTGCDLAVAIEVDAGGALGGGSVAASIRWRRDSARTRGS